MKLLIILLLISCATVYSAPSEEVADQPAKSEANPEPAVVKVTNAETLENVKAVIQEDPKPAVIQVSKVEALPTPESVKEPSESKVKVNHYSA